MGGAPLPGLRAIRKLSGARALPIGKEVFALLECAERRARSAGIDMPELQRARARRGRGSGGNRRVPGQGAAARRGLTRRRELASTALPMRISRQRFSSAMAARRVEAERADPDAA